MINWKRNGPSLTSKPYRHSWEDMSEAPPVDVLPCSNDEYFPPPATREQKAIMELASREADSIRGGGAGEIDPIQNLSRYHYLKELFLDSATTATVLSVVPTSPDTNNPLPIAEAALTVHTVNDLAKSRRSVMHAFVMPNRGSAGMTTPNTKPLYLDAELQLMME